MPGYLYELQYYTYSITAVVPFIVFALLYSLPPSRNSNTGSHSRLFPPLPTTVRAFCFYREKTARLLPESTRIEYLPGVILN